MCVPYVRYVLVKFLYYLSIYLGITRVPALCSQVLLLPPLKTMNGKIPESRVNTSV